MLRGDLMWTCDNRVEADGCWPTSYKPHCPGEEWVRVRDDRMETTSELTTLWRRIYWDTEQ
jgi:hypothetical protein